MDHQQSHNYLMQPPPPPHAPPSVADPYQRPPPLPPQQHGQPWPYSTSQFQYQIQHPPSLQPPQWAQPQPRSSDHSQYLPPPPPYPGHQHPAYPAHPHYPPSHPLPPAPSHAHQSYTQDLGNGNWSHQQSWDYRTNNIEQDWAEKARAWAVAKAAADTQYPVTVGRPEEQNYVHDQYPQSINPQYQGVHVTVEQGSTYQQYPPGMGASSRTGPDQLQESQYNSSGQSSFAADMHVAYAASGNLIGNEPTHPQENSSSPYQQEVPSSYSSVSGNEDTGSRYEQFNGSSSNSVHVTSMPHHHSQPLTPAGGRSGWVEEHHHLLGSKPDESVAGINDQPLHFSNHFNRNLDQHMQPNYTHPSGGTVRGQDPSISISSNYAWTPSSAPGIIHPPMPPTISSGTQVDHAAALPSPASAPIFPTGHGFQPPAPLIGASFGAGSGVVSHPTTSFSMDAYGASGVSERPKKASVPNWLREEIIKNKAVITSSASMLPREDVPSIEEDTSDKYSQKVDQSDSKSIDSSRSAEDDDDDEEVEAARTAAINKEIKHVLTEVLLKVTDELFDEIATKVLNEDDLSVEVEQNRDLSSQPLVPSTPSIPTSTATAKVLIPSKNMKVNSEDGSEKSTSGSAGDVLGLGSYATDEEDDEVQTGRANSKESFTNHSSSNKVLEDAPSIKNGESRKETEERGNLVKNLENTGREHLMIFAALNAAGTSPNDYRAVKEFSSSDTQRSSMKAFHEEKRQHGSDVMPNKSTTEKAVDRNERRDEILDARKSSDNSRIQKSGNRSDKNDIHANKKNPVEKDHRESEYVNDIMDKKGDENHRREEWHARTERKEYHNGSKDKEKEKSRIGEKAQDPEARKRSSTSDGKEVKSETRGDKRNSKEDIDEKKQGKARVEKRERSRNKSGSGTSRHKTTRSSSAGSGDSRKDNFVASHLNDSSDESSDASKRKSRHSKRHTSPSLTRSRKRQVSRSPHSKHSKRRHTHYSSLEHTRGRRSPSRSRSRSPEHWRR